MALDLGIFLEGSESTFKVKVSSNDTQPDYLINKFTSSDGSVTITETNDGGIEQINLTTSGGGGISSPLTTKGDLYTYDSADARLAVGADGQTLIADSAEATGLRWGSITADNMATADLSLTGNRTHDLNGFDLTFTGSNQSFSISSEGYLLSYGKSGNNTSTAFGDAALSSSVSEARMTAFGKGALQDLTSGTGGTAIGQSAGANTVSADEFVFIGDNAGNFSDGDDNTFVGASAGYVCDGNRNTFVGWYAGQAHTTNSNNVFLGARAGQYIVGSTNNTNSSECIYIGAQSFASALGVSNEIAIGRNAEGQGSNTCKWGNTSVTNHYFNGQLQVTGTGSTSATTTLLVENSSGEVMLRAIDNNQVYSRGNGDISTNTAFGEQSGLALTGGNNTFYGYQSGKANNSGTGNSVFGSSSFRLQTAGINNSAFGYQAMQNTTLASENCAFGRRALIQLSTGDDNVAIGSKAGDVVVGGGGNTNANDGVYLGSNTKPSASGNTNEIIVGYSAEGNGSNTATYGNTSVTDHYFNGGLTVQTTTNAFTPPVMTSTQASAITASNGMMLYVTDTNGTFTQVGFWGYESGAWVKL